jgi:hypothetical protein
MALPIGPLAGYTATLYCQPASGAPLATTTILSTLATVSALAIPANQIKVETIPAFGQDDAVANFAVAGSRQSDQIPSQSKPSSMAMTAAWNPADTLMVSLRADAYSGTAERTYIISATDGTNTIYYAFNGRIGQWMTDSSPSAEAKVMFTVHPRGNMYGWSNTV